MRKEGHQGVTDSGSHLKKRKKNLCHCLLFILILLDQRRVFFTASITLIKISCVYQELELNILSAAQSNLVVTLRSPHCQWREVDALPSCRSASIPAPGPETLLTPEEGEGLLFK